MENLPTVLVDPFRCQMWSLHDRLDEYLTPESCRDEIESVRRRGQVAPVLGRPLHGNPDYDVELVYGARRLFVARHLNLPLRVQLGALSDRDALLAMDAENRHRKDISPYERGLSYVRWLHAGHFSSQDELARALHISPAHVSRLVKIARLPTVVLDAFPSPLEICESWGQALAETWTDAARRDAFIKRARSLSAQNPRRPAREVFEQLIANTSRRRVTRRDQVVLSHGGTCLFRVRYQRKDVVIALSARHVTANMLEQIKEELADILERSLARDASRAAEPRTARVPKDQTTWTA